MFIQENAFESAASEMSAILSRSQCINMALALKYHESMPTRYVKSNRGWTRLSTWAKRGGILTDAWVYLHYLVVIWVAG